MTSEKNTFIMFQNSFFSKKNIVDLIAPPPYPHFYDVTRSMRRTRRVNLPKLPQLSPFLPRHLFAIGQSYSGALGEYKHTMNHAPNGNIGNGIDNALPHKSNDEAEFINSVSRSLQKERALSILYASVRSIFV